MLIESKKLLTDQVFVIKTYFNIKYNAIFDDNHFYKKLNLDPGEKYQLIHYELASNFNSFSTVKLIESEFDLTKKSLVLKKEFIVCSNNPQIEVKRCQLQNDGMLLMNNTRLLYMNNPMNNQYDTSFVPLNENEEIGGNNQSQQAKDYSGIDMTPGYKENLNFLKDDVSHLRLYHLLFYKSESNSRNSDSYTEAPILSVELNKC